MNSLEKDPLKGIKSAMLTRVGDEHMGRFIRETMQAEGVHVHGGCPGWWVWGLRDRVRGPRTGKVCMCICAWWLSWVVGVWP